MTTLDGPPDGPPNNGRPRPEPRSGTGADGWFNALLAGAELGLRKGTMSVVERYHLPRRLAGKLKSLACPGCGAVLELSRPVEDGQTIVCAACYGVYQIDVR